LLPSIDYSYHNSISRFSSIHPLHNNTMTHMNRTQTVTTQLAEHFSFRFGCHKTGKNPSYLPMVSTNNRVRLFFMLSASVKPSDVKILIYTLNEHWDLIGEYSLVKTRDGAGEPNRYKVDFDASRHIADYIWFRLDVGIGNIQNSIYYFGKISHGDRLERSTKYLTNLFGDDIVLDDTLTMDKIHERFREITKHSTPSASGITSNNGHPPQNPPPQSPSVYSINIMAHNPVSTHVPTTYQQSVYPQTVFVYPMDLMMQALPPWGGFLAQQPMNQPHWVSATTGTIASTYQHLPVTYYQRATDVSREGCTSSRNSTEASTVVDHTESFLDFDPLIHNGSSLGACPTREPLNHRDDFLQGLPPLLLNNINVPNMSEAVNPVQMQDGESSDCLSPLITSQTSILGDDSDIGGFDLENAVESELDYLNEIQNTQDDVSESWSLIPVDDTRQTTSKRPFSSILEDEETPQQAKYAKYQAEEEENFLRAHLSEGDRIDSESPSYLL